MATKTKHVLNVKQRVASGTGEARRLRKQGLIPAVVYSNGGAAKTISVNASEWESLQRFELNLISLQEDGNENLALVQEVQHDFIRKGALHIDFLEVDRNKKITAHVAVHAGHTAPIGVAQGGILEQVTHEIEVECLPEALPEAIVVDIAALNIGDRIHVGDLVAPEGVKILSAENLIAFVVADPNSEPAVEEPAPDAEAAAEPEVIGEKEKAEKAEAENKKK